MSAPIWLRPTQNYFRYPNSTSLKEQFKLTTNFVSEIESLCKPNAYNIVASKHLGDVFYFLGLKKIFEERFGESIHYILQPQHEFLAKLWGIDSYSVFQIGKLVKNNKAFITAFFDNPSPNSIDLDSRLENPYLMAAFSSIPQKGKPFLLENIYNNFNEYPYYWCFRGASSLGIEEEFRFPIPAGEIPVSQKTKGVVQSLGGLEKIILIAPEAATAIGIPPEWWQCICNQLIQKGYTLIVNSKRIKIQNAISTYDLNLSLEDVVSIGLKCHAIFSLRSGLSDVLVSAGSRLFVINPAMLRREQHSLDFPFEEATGVNEIQLYNWKISGCIFEDINISKLLEPYVRKAEYQCYKELFLSFFKGKGHRFWYNVYRNIAGSPKRYENNEMNPRPSKKSVNFGFLELYKSDSYKDDGDFINERSALNGLISIQIRQTGRKVKLFGIPIYAQKDQEERVRKIFGIPFQKKGRSDEFFNYLKSNLLEASKEIYGEGAIPDHVFIIRHNIGETTLYLAEYERWVRAINAKRPIFLIWRKRDIPLFKLFLGNCASVRYFEIAQSDINCFLKYDVTDLDGIRIHAPTYEIAESMKTQYLTNPYINFADWILKSMSLEDWGRPRLPKPSRAAENRATWLLNHKRITKPFVLLCPEAVSLKSVSDSFWSDIADHFIKSGFDVLVNYYSLDKKLQSLVNLKTCSPDIEVLFAVAKRAERIITMASGMGVLLSLAERPVDLIYTDIKNEHIGYSAEFCRKIYSVHHMPWIETKNAVEHIANQLDEILIAIKSRKL